MPVFNDTVQSDILFSGADFCDTLLSVSQVEPFAQWEFYHLGESVPDKGEVGVPRHATIAGDSVLASVLLLMFCMMAVITGRNKYFLVHRLKAFFTQKRTYAEEYSEANRSEVTNSLALTSIAAMSLAFILLGNLQLAEFDASMFIGDIADGMELYATLVLVWVGVIAFLAAKSLVYLFVNSVFFRTEEVRRWNSAYYLLSSLSAYILYPAALLAVFYDTGSGIVMSVLGFALFLYETLLFYRLCINFKTERQGFLLIFLYFCAVELMPLLIVGHLCGIIS